MPFYSIISISHVSFQFLNLQSKISIMKNSKARLYCAVLAALLSITMVGGCKKEDSTTPSCSDGIKNQNEIEVDCGGTCAACTNTCGVANVTDIDGNVYPVATIGTQCWMSSNLKTT